MPRVVHERCYKSGGGEYETQRVWAGTATADSREDQLCRCCHILLGLYLRKASACSTSRLSKINQATDGSMNLLTDSQQDCYTASPGADLPVAAARSIFSTGCILRFGVLVPGTIQRVLEAHGRISAVSLRRMDRPGGTMIQ